MAQLSDPLPAGNFMVGRAGHSMLFELPQNPSYLVLHTIGGGIASADAQFRDPSSHVSAHYGIGLDGSVIQWVSESDTAYHADNWTVDLTSIGIQHEDDGNDGPRTDALYSASSSLVREICLRYGIPISRDWIIRHRDVPGPGTACPDSLDIDRIVAMAAGSWHPGPLPPQPAAAEAAAPDKPSSTSPTPVSSPQLASAGPAAPDQPVSIPPTPVSAPQREVPPTTGDPLRDLATVLYGDQGRWHDIYDSIKGVVSDVPVFMQLEKMLTAGPAMPVGPAPEPTSIGAAPAPAGAPPGEAEAPTAGVAAAGGGPQPGAAQDGYWGGSAAAVFALQIIYLTVLTALAIIYFTNRSLIVLPDSIGPLSVAIPWYGALGAVLMSLVGVTQHRRDWDPSYRFWHWARPLLGASFGSISVLIFQAGILAVGTTPSTGSPNGGAIPKDLLYYLVAFVVGFREETFRELVKRLVDVIFSPGTTAVALSISSMKPQTGPAAGGTAVTILGTGLAGTDSVRFGVSQAAFHIDGDGQLTVTSPVGQAASAVTVSVTAQSASAAAGTFTYSS